MARRGHAIRLCREVQLGWSRSSVLLRAGVPSIERRCDDERDRYLAPGATTVMVYSFDMWVGPPMVWLFYLHKDQVVVIQEDGTR